ncbi:MAG: hypothetical protein ACREXS_19120 [Gammaproteobacteria bacterium]
MKLLVVGVTDDPNTLVIEGVQLDTVKAILDRVGIPYDLATYQAGAPLTSLPNLEDAATNHAYYQSVIFALSDVRMNPYIAWGGPQATDDALRLAAYAYKYNVRVASLFGWPFDTGCLGLSGSGVSIGSAPPANALLTAAGRTALPYLKAGTNATFPLQLKQTFLYNAPALPATGGTTPGVDILPAGTTVTPWLTYNSASIAAMCQFADGTGATRQLLALTVNNAPYLTHTMALSYGVVRWVTKGIHLGEKQVWLDAEVDDIFLPDDEYPNAVLDDGQTYNFEDVTRYNLGIGPAPTPIPCTVTDPATGAPCEYRITATDFNNALAWQNKARPNSWGGAKTINNRTTNTANANGTDGLRINMVYNGVLATLAEEDRPCGALCEPLWPGDTLTGAVDANSNEFKWVNHTWDHTNLDAMAYTSTGTCPNTVLDAKTEVCWNHAVKQVLGLGKYDKEAFVTPDISGLYNRDVMDAFAVFAATPYVYLTSDSSRPTPPENALGCPPGPNPADPTARWPLPAPNSGKYNCTALTITATRPTPRYVYEVPRYPVALFYLVTNSTEWTNAYNFFYGANHVFPTPGVPPFVDGAGNPRNQTYAEIVDYVADTLLGYLLTYDSRPWMFHSANLRKYSGTRSLLGDLLEETLTKYNSIYQVQPIRSPRLKAIGERMRKRMVYNAMGVKGVLTPGQSIDITAVGSNAITLTNPADGAAVVVPVTGVASGPTPGTGLANNPMTYGSGAAAQTISYITLTPGTGYSATVTPAPAW